MQVRLREVDELGRPHQRSELGEFLNEIGRWGLCPIPPARPLAHCGLVPATDDLPPGVLLDLLEATRLLSALVRALLVITRAGLEPGLQDELETLVWLLARRLGFSDDGHPGGTP